MLATVLELVCFTYISPSVSATVCDALPLSTAALVVLRVSVAMVVMWRSAVWFGCLWGFVSGVTWSSCPSFHMMMMGEGPYPK